MLDLERLNRIRLTNNPIGQKIVATTLLMPNYGLPPRVRIDLEGTENLPDEPVIFAMNHTDRYNYWPFQYKLWRDQGRFTATWVKGKYYENEAIGWFMENMNNIPTVSRGYIIAKDFAAVMDRPPEDTEYKALRGEVDRVAGVREAGELEIPTLAGVPDAILNRRRNVLGLEFHPGKQSYAEYINTLFQTMMRRFVDLNYEAMRKGLDLLIFPQGTRSIRLSKGHIGLAQIALHAKKTVVPVGCSGSDEVYPGSSPFGKGGHITYRIGEPLTYDDMTAFHIDQDFEPFTPEAEERHRERFQSYVDVVMDRINELVEPKYQFAEDLESDGVQGSGRFI
jgi:1-acyl-sn-glycerol-3-phosphate acyltransferase